MRLAASIALLRTQSDERLTALAREGSEPAFTALVERYRRNVLRACMRVLPEARAEDATQQVFVAAWKALNRGDDVRDVRPWLLRIARNTSLNALRTPGYEYDELAESLHGGSAPPAELERRDVMRQTLAGLAALPENQREALLRSAVHGAAHADIARDLGISEGATRQLVLRARATLRSAVTAVTPLPLLTWAASGSGAGIAEVAASGGAAGATALIAKAGAVVVLAGGAAATPALVADRDPSPARTAQRAARTPAPVVERDGAREAVPAEAEAEEVASAPQRTAPARTPTPRKARRRRRPAVAPVATASPSPSPTPTPTPTPTRDNSGPGSSGDDDDDHSGHGGGGDDGKRPVPTPTKVPTASPAPTVNPNSGSGGSGSGSSGSGSSGSGSSGPGDSGSRGRGEDDGDHSGHGGGEDDD